MKKQADLLGLVAKFQEKILKTISSGCDIRQNYRPFQKQDGLKVNHFHIHLLPREFKDELYEKCQVYERDIFKKLTPEEEKSVLELLK